MAKHTRVYQVAKDHRVSSEVLMGILPNLGIEVKRHTDRIDEEDVERIEAWFAKYPDGVAPEGEEAEAETETAEAAQPEPEAEETAEPAETVEPAADETPAESETQPARKPPAPSMPPPEPVTRVFMPPVETSPPPPPPKPLTKPKAPEKRAEEPAKGDELARAPRRTEAQEARAEKPAKPEKSEKPRPTEQETPRGGRRDSRPAEKDTPERSGRQIVRGRPAAASSSEEGAGPRRKRGKKRKKPTVSAEEIQRNVQKTLSQMDRGRVRKSYVRRDDDGVDEEVLDEAARETIRVTEFVSVSGLADIMGIKPNEVIAECMKLGLMVSLNQRLEWETIELIADEFNFDVERMEDKELSEPDEEEDRPEDLKPRSPIVTVMGHVDHGKTSLLDHIRRTNVIAGESGGITQHIGAYKVETGNGDVTFLDTPGHEAFTAMRARGAQATDVVVLVVAADDSVMPQTVEAINHARAAQVPIIVAINKIDLPAANPDRIKQQLTEHNIIVEDYGGSTQSVLISAKHGDGVDNLLELLALETELLDLKANPDKPARGVVVEARLDKGRGPVATVLVQSGTLRVGDPFLVGMHSGRVRALLDERGNRVEEAGPSEPVQVLGLDDTPTAGDTFMVYEDEREARGIAQTRQQLQRQQEFSRTRKVSLSNLSERIAAGGLKTLPVVVKGDVDGSVEALSDELGKLSNEEVGVEVIHRGVGAITESDVLLASASDAIIIGFHVRPDARARELAEQERVEIHLYQVIYEAIEDLTASLAGMLEARVTEKVTGEVEVRELFKVRRIGTIAGCMVRSGSVKRNDRIRVIRDGQTVYDGAVGTLKRHKDDAREVAAGFECGIWVENFNDVKIGDILEAYTLVEEAREFQGATA